MKNIRKFNVNGSWIDTVDPHDFDVINPAT